ncbi:MAG: GNAT family N-acetyltransferase [Bdellovibrionales bacterium]
MKFQITQFNHDDKDSWFALRYAADSWPKDNNREDIVQANWQKIIDNNNPLNALALRYNQALVGYGLYFFSPCIRTSTDECMVRDIFITPEYRRKGGATMIMNTIESEAEKAKAGRLFWVANPARQDMLAFCQSYHADIDNRPEKVFIKWLKAAHDV